METVAFCDHQKISLRGHGDDSKHQQDSATVNLGNFISLIMFGVMMMILF